MSFRLVTAPSEKVISTAEAKLHLRADSDNTEDALIDSLIVAATSWCEKYTNQCFVTQTWELSLSEVCTSVVDLKAPLSSVTSINYTDTAGNPQLLDPSKYQVDLYSLPGNVLPAYGVTWPLVREGVGAFKVRFVAGFGAATLVPDDIKCAIKLLVGHLYSNREAVTTFNADEVPFGVRALLSSYRIISIY